MSKLLSATAIALVMLSTGAMATEKPSTSNTNLNTNYNSNSNSNTNYNNNSNYNNNNAYAHSNSNSKSYSNSDANAYAKGGNAASSSDATSSPETNVDASSDNHWTYYAPAYAPDLASGSNDDLAPNSYSGGISALFFGISFGWSEQQVSPTGGMKLISIAMDSAKLNGTLTTPIERLRAEKATRFLCKGGYAYMISEVDCEQVDN